MTARSAHFKAVSLLIGAVFCTPWANATVEWRGRVEPLIRAENDRTDWAGGRADFSGRLAFGETRDDFGLVAKKGHQITWDLRHEAYLESAESWSQIRELGLRLMVANNHETFVGQDILIWGKADYINPLDVWNAENFRFFLLEDKDDRKRARPFFIHDFKRGDVHLQLVAAPRTAADRHVFADRNSRWCYRDCQIATPSVIREQLSAAGVQSEFRRLSEDERRAFWEFGARWAHRWGPLDYSWMVHSGADRFPLWRRRWLAGGGVRFEEFNERVTSWGGDAAWAFGSYSLRTEVRHWLNKFYPLKFTAPTFVSDDDGLREIQELEWVIGLDRSIGEGGYVNVQYYVKSPLDATRDLILFEGRRLITAHARQKLPASEDWEVHWLSVWDLDADTASHNPEIQYRFSDTLKARAQVYFFSGRAGEGLFGSVGSKPLYELRAEYTF